MAKRFNAYPHIAGRLGNFHRSQGWRIAERTTKRHRWIHSNRYNARNISKFGNYCDTEPSRQRCTDVANRSRKIQGLNLVSTQSQLPTTLGQERHKSLSVRQPIANLNAHLSYRLHSLASIFALRLDATRPVNQTEGSSGPILTLMNKAILGEAQSVRYIHKGVEIMSSSEHGGLTNNQN